MPEPIRSPEFDQLVGGLRRQTDLAQKAGNRPIIQLSRQYDANVDVLALPGKRGGQRCGRVLPKDVGGHVTEDHIGQFWFVVGYSAMDGGDVLRP